MFGSPDIICFFIPVHSLGEYFLSVWLYGCWEMCSTFGDKTTTSMNVWAFVKFETDGTGTIEYNGGVAAYFNWSLKKINLHTSLIVC